MYSPDTLDRERSSWRTVVYFNVARSVKRILEILESHGDMFDENAPEGPPHDSISSKRTLEDIIRHDIVEESSSSHTSHPYTASTSAAVTESQKQIATLRLRLSPLVAAESTLADRLSGGVRVSGSGKGSVYVRHGWQLRSGGRNLSYRASGSSASPVIDGGSNSAVSEVVEEVGRILDNSKEDVKALWRSDVVQKMIKRRRLRLEEWTELYVPMLKLNVPPDLIVNSFLAAIDRVAARGYVPSTGKSFDLPFSHALTGCLQRIFFTHAFRRWALPNIFSMCLCTAKLLLGTFTMLVAHEDNGIPGCPTLMKLMRSFLSRQSAHLIRCVRIVIQLVSQG
jgi:guanine nucleotide-binding protein subunit alpha